MNVSKPRLAAIVALAFVAGWIVNDYVAPAKRPRPILNFIKNWWWVPLILDEPTPDQGVHHHHPHTHDEPQLGTDGYPLVDHRRAL